MAGGGWYGYDHETVIGLESDAGEDMDDLYTVFSVHVAEVRPDRLRCSAFLYANLFGKRTLVEGALLIGMKPACCAASGVRTMGIAVSGTDVGGQGGMGEKGDE